MQAPVAPLARNAPVPYAPRSAKPSAQMPCHPRSDRNRSEIQTPILPVPHPYSSLASRRVQEFDDRAAIAPRFVVRDAKAEVPPLRGIPSRLPCPTPAKCTAAFVASLLPQSRNRISIPTPARSTDRPPDIPLPASRIPNWPSPDKSSRALRNVRCVRRASVPLAPAPSGEMASTAILRALSEPGQSRETNSAMKKLSAPTRTASSCSFHPQTVHPREHPREYASPASAHK